MGDYAGIAFVTLCGFLFIQRGKREIRQDVADTLRAYAQVQYLTGIVVFDGLLKQKCSIEDDREVTRSLWDKILEENKRKEIKNNDNKQKVMTICLLLLSFPCFLLF